MLAKIEGYHTWNAVNRRGGGILFSRKQGHRLEERKKYGLGQKSRVAVMDPGTGDVRVGEKTKG